MFRGFTTGGKTKRKQTQDRDQANGELKFRKSLNDSCLTLLIN